MFGARPTPQGFGQSNASSGFGGGPTMPLGGFGGASPSLLGGFGGGGLTSGFGGGGLTGGFGTSAPSGMFGQPLGLIPGGGLATPADMLAANNPLSPPDAWKTQHQAALIGHLQAKLTLAYAKIEQLEQQVARLRAGRTLNDVLESAGYPSAEPATPKPAADNLEERLADMENRIRALEKSTE